jgi:hypothetical protein
MTLTRIDVDYKDDILRQLYSVANDRDVMVWVVGGYVRRKFLKQDLTGVDIDLVFRTEEDRTRFLGGFEVARTCKRFTSFVFCGREVQCLHRTGETLEDFFTRFDFTLCQFAACEDGAYASLRALVDVQDRRLTPTTWILEDTEKDRIRLLPQRILKYTKQGFKISTEDLAKLLEQYQRAKGWTDEGYNL